VPNYEIVNNNIKLFNEFNIMKDKFYEEIKYKVSLHYIKKGIIRRIFFLDYKKNYELNEIQKEVIIGLLLGDGFLEKSSKSVNPRFCFEQSYPEKEVYLFYVFNFYKLLVSSFPSIITRKPDKRTGKVYKSLGFKTAAFSCLNEYYNLFYKDRKKVIPKSIDKLLTARGLAHWIMDDGSKNFYNQTILHKRAFTKEEVILLQNTLKKNFGLKSRLEEKVKNQWIIIINVRQTISLKEIVKPYMHESMVYKI